jgi:transcription factor S
MKKQNNKNKKASARNGQGGIPGKKKLTEQDKYLLKAYKKKYRYFCPVKLKETGKQCMKRFRTREQLSEHFQKEHNKAWKQVWDERFPHRGKPKKAKKNKTKGKMDEYTKKLNEIFKERNGERLKYLDNKNAEDKAGFMVTKQVKKELNFQDKKIDGTEPKTRISCPKCEHNEAYWILRQTRASDEPETRIYTCCKCKHSWREY